jgi:hypothetical protein
MRCGASDEEIEKLFIDSVKIKPKRHMLNDNRSSIDIIRSMSKIGG